MPPHPGSDAGTLVADPSLEALLQFLKHDRGFDFTGYKRGNLARRILKRMGSVGAATFAEYQDFLQVYPSEFEPLFDTILINVTSFFRDEAAWQHIETVVLPQLGDAPRQGPIRIWSAGCSSGQEAYSLVIAASRALGEERVRDDVKIYATDVDEDALAQARAGSYDGRALRELDDATVERFFERQGEHYGVRPDLRRSVIFGRHDLVQDAPISRIDLLVCRNTLMYFNAEAQAHILSRFAFALRPDGYLLLGKSETLISRLSAFVPVELKQRIFRRQPVAVDGRRPGVAAGADAAAARRGAPNLTDAAFEHAAAAQLIVDLAGTLVLANQQARVLFGLDGASRGRPFHELELSYRPVELRSRIDDVISDAAPVVVREVEWPVDGHVRRMDVHLTPLVDRSGELEAISIAYADVTRYRALQDEYGVARRELETAYEELQSTIEELETTNEELQSTNEELETTNEELQSTNEELETMNEELESTNEELETINDELRTRSGELDRANAFLESILTSMEAAVVVVDRELRVQVWNGEAAELWGVREDEVVDAHFLNLDIGLPLDHLRQPLRQALNGGGGERLELPARNRRGRDITCAVTLLPLATASGGVSGAILLMEPVPG